MFLFVYKLNAEPKNAHIDREYVFMCCVCVCVYCYVYYKIAIFNSIQFKIIAEIRIINERFFSITSEQ